eukprot:SAG31_NODE_940_length_10870_cov_12.600501_2_plen_151_part_00
MHRCVSLAIQHRFYGSAAGHSAGLASTLAEKYRKLDAQEEQSSSQLLPIEIDRLCAAVAMHGGGTGANIQWNAVASTVAMQSTAHEADEIGTSSKGQLSSPEQCRAAWRGILRRARREKMLARGDIPSPCSKVCKLDAVRCPNAPLAGGK